MCLQYDGLEQIGYLLEHKLSKLEKSNNGLNCKRKLDKVKEYRRYRSNIYLQGQKDLLIKAIDSIADTCQIEDEEEEEEEDEESCL